MSHALVLGAGMVGSVMAFDLARHGYRVTIADANPDNLARASSRDAARITPARADLSDPAAIASLASTADVVLGALPSRLGFAAMRAVIESKRHYCDISFMTEDFESLDALAKSKGVTIIADCGVAPGMSHILSAHGSRLLDTCHAIEIYVGGLPRERRWPFEYKAAFAPADVIEEYTRPSRLVEHGQVVTREALSEPELMDFPGVGTLEAFNTDGLRSLTTSLRVPFMKEKTLRYPGHIALMRAMRETGLFSLDPIDVKGQRVVPRELTSALLFPKWTYQPGEADLTVMRVMARGLKGNTPTTHTWDLFDVYDPDTNCTSMARTTAFPATIVAGLLASGRFREPGVHPPERLATDPGLVETLLAQLASRGVRYVHTLTQP
ncbi:MAG: FAD-dependent oxidoreductase [Tepidisphaera sp.]|nr:FAD-dependent oxidoreductase [Tepidisphaera sp.]